MYLSPRYPAYGIGPDSIREGMLISYNWPLILLDRVKYIVF